MDLVRKDNPYSPPDISLDFLPAASVSGRVMPDNDARQKMAADLTALFEDAAGLAVDGQAPVLSVREARAIAEKIQNRVQDATKTLVQLI